MQIRTLTNAWNSCKIFRSNIFSCRLCNFFDIVLQFAAEDDPEILSKVSRVSIINRLSCRIVLGFHYFVVDQSLTQEDLICGVG